MAVDLIHKNESYSLIGPCMDIHKELGKGFNEVVYADALEHELKEMGFHLKVKKNLKSYTKGKKLAHNSHADFVMDNKIIIELKAIERLTSSHVKQVLNYLAVSKMKLGLLINFGEDSLAYKRVIL